jgi:hypothetical protein
MVAFGTDAPMRCGGHPRHVLRAPAAIGLASRRAAQQFADFGPSPHLPVIADVHERARGWRLRPSAR